MEEENKELEKTTEVVLQEVEQDKKDEELAIEAENKNNLPMILILVVLIGAIGTGIGFYIISGHDKQPAPEEQQEEKKEEEKTEEKEKQKETKEIEVEDTEVKEKIENLVNKMFDTSYTDQKRVELFRKLKAGKKGLTVPEKLHLTFYINEIKFEVVTNLDEVKEEYREYAEGGFIKRIKHETIQENYKKLFNEDYSPKDFDENKNNFKEGFGCPNLIYEDENTKEYYFLSTCGGGAVAGFTGKYTSSIEKITKKDNNYYAYLKLIYTNEGQEDEITNIKFVFDNNIVFVETIVE